MVNLDKFKDMYKQISLDKKINQIEFYNNSAFQEAFLN